MNFGARLVVLPLWVFVLGGGACTPAAASSTGGIVGDFVLWDENVPLPAPDSLASPDQTVDVVVQRADGEYHFLHDNAVVWHGNTLFAGWYNCPKGEIQESSCIRSRHSSDGGKTWSPVEVIAADQKGEGVFYVPVTFLSRGGSLFAYVSNMVGHDLVTGLPPEKSTSGSEKTSRL